MTCIECGAPTSGLKRQMCDECSRAHIFKNGMSLSHARSMARGVGLEEIFWTCETHGVTLHSVKTARCCVCIDLRAPRNKARHEGRSTYLAGCGRCGSDAVEHHVNTGKCLTCFTANGLLRAPRGQVTGRRLARLAGSTSYEAVCAHHGATAFGVHSGKCLTCFTSTGTPRKDPASRGSSLRAMARRRDQPTYLHWCEKHGETAHSTARGKCLTCFTANGSPRRFIRVPVDLA